MVKINNISFLDNTSLHLPHLMSQADRNNLNLDKIIVTDSFIHHRVNNKLKIAWLVEPESIYPYSYQFIRHNFKNYDYVVTYAKSLLDTIPNSIFYPFGTTFINEKDYKIYDKNKNISMIASDKTLCNGHVFRHEIRKFVQNKVDVYGRGINTINDKLEGLKNYRYSIAMENSKHDYYFTEKIIDCFLTGTIPIYWGCPGIGKFFNLDGLITFNSQQELSEYLQIADENYYLSKRKAIEDNFNLAKKYTNIYDDVYNFVDSIII